MLTCINRQIDDYFAKQVNLQEIFLTQKLCLKASTDAKIWTSLEREKKKGGPSCGSRNRPLIDTSPIVILKLLFTFKSSALPKKSFVFNWFGQIYLDKCSVGTGHICWNISTPDLLFRYLCVSVEDFVELSYMLTSENTEERKRSEDYKRRIGETPCPQFKMDDMIYGTAFGHTIRF